MKINKIEKLIIENFGKVFNRIKRIDDTKLNEASFVYDVPKEDSDFLDRVKSLTPELYNKFYTLYRNRGLEAAKSEYEKIDPEVLKQKAKDEKKAQTLKNRKEMLRGVKELLPSKEDIKNSVDRIILTSDFRKISQQLLFPQLTIANMDAKVKSHTMEDMLVYYTFSSYMSFKSPEELFKYFENIGTDDSILDDMLKAKNKIKSVKNMQKWGKEYYDEYNPMYDYMDKNLKFKSELQIRVQIRKNLIPTGMIYVETYYTTEMTTPGEGLPENLLRVHSATKCEIANISNPNDCVINSLIKLKTKLIDDSEGVMNKIISSL